jgi:hypothetical protein
LKNTSGVVGICSPDWDGFILSPVLEQVAAAIAEYLALQLEAAGESPAGAALRNWALLPWTLFAQAWVSVVAVK